MLVYSIAIHTKNKLIKLKLQIENRTLIKLYRDMAFFVNAKLK